MPTKTRKFIEQFKSFFSQAKGELSALREKIAVVTEELDELGKRGLDLESAKAKLREGIAEIGNRFAEDRFKQVPFMNQASHADALTLNFQRVDPFAFMCWLQPDLVQQKMEVALREFLERIPGISPTEKTVKASELQKLLQALELQEEELIRQGQEVGLRIPRRPDANPEVVLNQS